MTRPLQGTIATSVLGVEELRQSLTQRGWRVGLVRGGTSRREALAAIGTALEFPDYYGVNLDALWDCLGDLGQPTALVWAGWEPLAVHAPRDWVQLIRVLAMRAQAEDQPAFAAVFLVAPRADPATRRSC